MFTQEKQLCELQAIAKMLEEAITCLDVCGREVVAAHVQAGLDLLRNGETCDGAED